MSSELAEVLNDAATFQQGLNAFDSTDFARQCPSTELIYADIVNPDIEPEEEEDPTVKDGKVATSITVRDYCTGDVIPGATVSVDGKNYTANADGYVYLGYLDAGQDYPVSISGTGYTDSGSDTLPNDSITIPEA